jgi:cell division protein FtsZ
VKAIMSHAGSALMAIGRAAGENRAVEAAQAAISSPLLEVSISGAKGVLFNIAGSDYTLYEVNQAARVIQEAADQDANIIFGATIDERLQDEIQITVIATGFEGQKQTVQRSGVRNRPERPLTRPQYEQAQDQKQEQPQRPRTEPSPYTRPDTGDNDDYDIPAFIRRR